MLEAGRPLDRIRRLLGPESLEQTSTPSNVEKTGRQDSMRRSVSAPNLLQPRGKGNGGDGHRGPRRGPEHN
jgi:hypothetical protein